MRFDRLNNIISNSGASMDGTHLLYQKERQMPDVVDVLISRYNADHITESQLDSGVIAYNINPSESRHNKSLNLKFCLQGNCYCTEKCGDCLLRKDHKTIDFLEFRFNPFFLKKMVSVNTPQSKKEKVLSFKYPRSFTKNIPVEDRKRQLLNALLESKIHEDVMENLLVHTQVNQLLLYSMEALIDDKDDNFTCPISVEADFINRLYDAKTLLQESLSTPITIKELSRKVAMNECYLKKGFKELFGTTIFDFYQRERMSHAKYLLYEKGFTVTEVSDLLGYSSISHFSTAFKKLTGLRPCELLLKSS